eukprot:TRINITY_DN1611_c0_g1_i1.p1 TRINITY_DN1611_c0_g1~~TRINITY_DN1611_c0_g1_i1.p1  ORF type:complete len:130 (+),score=30.31 TRINITY_DN1611_c0_g1_i1:585-974(+)
MICFDLEFPEVCRTFAIQGAEVLIAIAASTSSFVPLQMVAVRAMENNVFTGYVNRVGFEEGSVYGGIDATFAGCSSFYDPFGNVVGKIGDQNKPESLIIQLDHKERIQQSIQENPYLATRRESLYHLTQ